MEVRSNRQALLLPIGNTPCWIDCQKQPFRYVCVLKPHRRHKVEVIVLEDVDTVLPAPLPATVPIVTAFQGSAASTLPDGVTMVTLMTMGMLLPHAPPPHIAPDVVTDADDVDHVGA